jgi:hypothetical protein
MTQESPKIFSQIIDWKCFINYSDRPACGWTSRAEIQAQCNILRNLNEEFLPPALAPGGEIRLTPSSAPAILTSESDIKKP